jgi:hypothetical protein
MLGEAARRVCAELDIKLTGGRCWTNGLHARNLHAVFRTGDSTEHKRAYAVNPPSISVLCDHLEPLVLARRPGKRWNLEQHVLGQLPKGRHLPVQPWCWRPKGLRSSTVCLCRLHVTAANAIVC